MTKKEIRNGNKTIAGFMIDDEGVLYTPRMTYSSELGKEIDDFSLDDSDFRDMKYHKSWDWLMPVVNKIENEGHRFSLFSCEEHCEVVFTDMAIPGNTVVKVKSYDYNDKIEVVYETVVEFIKNLKK